MARPAGGCGRWGPRGPASKELGPAGLGWVGLTGRPALLGLACLGSACPGSRGIVSMPRRQWAGVRVGIERSGRELFISNR